MMQGVVNLRCEATLTVVVGNSNRKLEAFNTVDLLHKYYML
jgi:hypothetical protein